MVNICDIFYLDFLSHVFWNQSHVCGSWCDHVTACQITAIRDWDRVYLLTSTTTLGSNKSRSLPSSLPGQFGTPIWSWLRFVLQRSRVVVHGGAGQSPVAVCVIAACSRSSSPPAYAAPHQDCVDLLLGVPHAVFIPRDHQRYADRSMLLPPDTRRDPSVVTTWLMVGLNPSWTSLFCIMLCSFFGFIIFPRRSQHIF